MTHPPASSTIRAHVVISGQVQGVGYRAATWDTAAVLKLNGWVKNLRDGRVEAVFEGPAERVDDIIRWCYQGSPAAVVQNVEITYEPPEGISGFHIAR